MSYLTLDAGALDNFSEAIISFWFRVPQASIDACFAQPGNDPPGPFDNTIPLVVMGGLGETGGIVETPKQVVNNIFTPEGPGGVDGYNTYVLTSSPTGPLTTHYVYTVTANETPLPSGGVETSYAEVFSCSAGPKTPTFPTFIGVDAGNPDRGYPPSLNINFESGKVGDGSGYWLVLTSITPGIGSGTTCGLISYTGQVVNEWDDLGVDQWQNQTSSGHIDAEYGSCTSTTTQVQKENYTDETSLELVTTAAISSDTVTVTPDEWHHVLISLAFGEISTHGGNPSNDFMSFIDSAAQLYVALDDQNYTGNDLGTVDPSSANGFINQDAFRVAGTLPDPDTGDIASYTVHGLVSAADGPVGIPATSDYVDNIFEVEMAEFQLFTGISRDTSDVSVRRLFIDDQGKPVPPHQKASDTKGSGSIEGLGQMPDILLHGSGNWANGRNTGSLGVDADGQTIATGQFTPTAVIRPYKPEPSLYGPQADA